MLSFRAQLVSVLTVLLLLFAVAAGVATLATLNRTLEEDGLRDGRQAVVARRDQITSAFTLRHQRAAALLESVASNCDQSGRINSACAADALDDWAKRDRVLYTRLSFPRMRVVEHGPVLATDPVLYRDARGLKLTLAVSDAWSGGQLTAVFDASPVEAAAAAPFRAAANGSVSLLNASGQSLMPVAASRALEAAAAQCRNHEETGGVVHDGATRTLIAISLLPSNGGCVVAQLPVADLLQPSVQLGKRFGTIVGVFLFLSIGIAILLAYVMARPLVALTRRVEAMSAGDFDSVVPRSGPAEIRTFADAFARMARSLKQSHEALRQNEEKLRLSYRAAHLWPWEASLTRGYFRWMEFDDDKPIMREEPLSSVFEHVHAEDRAMVLQTLETTPPGSTFHIEFRYSTRDGDTIWLASRGEVLQRITGPILIGVNLDVTNRRRMEELERDRERLAASAHIAAELAHEVNNPLAAVSGALYLLRGAMPGTKEYDHCLDIATEATDRITHIARQLLGLYQQSGKAEPLDVTRVIREVLDLYRRQANTQDVRLTADLPAEAKVSGNPAELRTAIANVVSNALANVGQDGHIVVRVRTTRERRIGRNGVRITVSDNGSGIAPENRGRVFEAFFSTSEQRGTGLGLWVTSNIIRKHYGTIRVRSAQHGPRPGTTVSIFLPRRDSEDALRHSATHAA
jgi:signal transduction histidine kinase/HAMP domain-containing protein